MTETESWLARLAAALERGDIAQAKTLFADDCYWRDLIAFTWNIVTFESREAIGDMLQARLGDVRPHAFEVDARENWFRFETSVGRGVGHVRLKDGKCWTLFTALMELKGFEEKAGASRETGVEHGAIRGRRTWTDGRQVERDGLGYSQQPYVLVVGGGQAASVSARG